MILLENINKYYGNGSASLHVLKDVTLQVDKGEFVTVLGESGSGKSTLMNIIGCMDGFDSGKYFIEGTAVKSEDRDMLADIRNKKIGFIFQKYHLIQKYTILQNVMMPLLLRGESSRQAEEKAFSALQSVGLGERVRHKPNQLSGGQQQRAAIARAIVTKPSLLLADEPTGALDSKTGDEIMDLFSELNKNGHTIIQITHNPKVAEVSDRILYLRDGKLFER